MNVPNPPLPPASPLPVETLPPPAEAAGDLDADIARVEQRLLAREERLRRHTRSAVERARSLVPSQRTALAAGGAVLALGGLWWWSRRRRERQRGGVPRSGHGHQGWPQHAAQAPFSGRQAAAAIPWVGLIGFLMPLLPPRWRARASPATVATLLALAPSVLRGLRWLTARRRVAPPV